MTNLGALTSEKDPWQGQRALTQTAADFAGKFAGEAVSWDGAR